MKSNLLFKYCPAANLKFILEGSSLRVKSPSGFNDPFEVRPYFDNARKERYDDERFAIYREVYPEFRDELTGVPVEQIVDYDTRLHAKLVKQIDVEYRILCLSRKNDHILMWSHYADEHRGFVVGIDPDTPGFNGGLNPTGYVVEYKTDRLGNQMPVSFYGLLDLDIDGNPVVKGHQEVVSDGGVIIPATTRSEIYEESLLKVLTRKYTDWAYEDEVRFIYRISRHNSPSFVDPFETLQIPAEAFRAVIVGHRTPVEAVENLVAVQKLGKYPHLELFYTDFHPFEYKVRIHEAQTEYLKDLYRTRRNGKGIF